MKEKPKESVSKNLRKIRTYRIGLTKRTCTNTQTETNMQTLHLS